MDRVIEVRGLTKRFGAVLAVDDLSFTVAPGAVTGFLGANGAGKSTTMRMVLGLDAPTAGTAIVAGRRYRDLRRPAREVGALLDPRCAHPGRTARAHLLWMADLAGVGRGRVDEVLELAGVAAVARRRIGALSLGQRQRVGLAGALLGVDLAAVGAMVLGATAAGGEWATGQALPTFLLQPRRERVVLAKAVSVAGAAALVGAAAALLCTGLAGVVLGARDLPGDALRLAAGAVLTPVLYAVVACAAGLALRSTGGGVLVALLLLALPTAAGWLGLPVALLPAAALHSLSGTAGPAELVGAPTAVLSLLGWTALALGVAVGRVRARDV